MSTSIQAWLTSSSKAIWWGRRQDPGPGQSGNALRRRYHLVVPAPVILRVVFTGCGGDRLFQRLTDRFASAPSVAPQPFQLLAIHLHACLQKLLDDQDFMHNRFRLLLQAAVNELLAACLAW